jgi:hypothetical protein
MQPWRRRKREKEREGERERRGGEREKLLKISDLLLQRSHQKFEFGGLEINKRRLLPNSAD